MPLETRRTLVSEILKRENLLLRINEIVYNINIQKKIVRIVTSSCSVKILDGRNGTILSVTN